MISEEFATTSASTLAAENVKTVTKSGIGVTPSVEQPVTLLCSEQQSDNAACATTATALSSCPDPEAPFVQSAVNCPEDKEKKEEAPQCSRQLLDSIFGFFSRKMPVALTELLLELG